MPTSLPNPPVLAESADPFTDVRVIDLVARLPRGRAVGLPAVVDRLNATYTDWLFEARVVADAILQLQSNWIADYRSTTGIVLDEGPDGATVTIEDSTRVDPWIARQAQRLADACRATLDDFSRRDRRTGGD
jgi:sigma54-dependent transcription regulator